mgnify:CR=1 FL=1
MRSLSLLMFFLCSLNLSAQTDFTFNFDVLPDSMSYEELQPKIEEAYHIPFIQPDSFYHKLIPYGERLIELSEEKHGELAVKFGYDLNYVSQLYQFTQNYKRSNELLKVVLKIVLHNEDDQHIDYARMLIAISMNHFLLSDVKQATDYFLKAEPILPKLLQSSEVDYQTQLYSVATLYEVLGRFEKAAKYFRKFADLSKFILGDKHMLYAEGLLSLGNVLLQSGQFKAAKAVLDSSLQIKESQKIKDQHSYLKTLNSIANYYTQTYQYDTSITILQEVVDLRSVDSSSLAYATSLQNLAITYFEASKYELAIPLMQEAVELKKELVGISHYQYLDAISNYIGILGKAGEFESALPHLEYLQYYVDTTALKKHPMWIRMANSLGHFYGLAGQRDKALTILVKAEEVIEEIAGKKHLFFARSQNNLAEIYSQLGDWDKAEKYYLIAKSIWETELGKSTFEFASVLGNLATVYSYRGDFKRAIELLEKSVDLHARCKGKKNLSYIEGLNNLALAYQKDQQIQKASQTFQQALELADTTFQKGHPAFFLLYTNLGRFHEENKELYKAVQFYLKAEQVGKIIFPTEHPEYTVNLLGLGSVYEKLGKLPLASNFFQTLLECYLIQFNSYYPVLSEQGKLMYYDKEKSKMDLVLSFFHRHPPKDANVHKLLLEFSIQMKQLGLAYQRDRITGVTVPKDEQWLAYAKARKLIRSQLTEILINPKTQGPNTLEKLQHDLEVLETKMGIRSGERNMNLANRTEAVSIGDVLGSLTDGTSYLEYYHFRYHNGSTLTDSILYYAFVVEANQRISEPIYICQEREILEIIGEKTSFYMKYVQDGHDLKQIIWNKLIPYLPESREIEIAPVGQINRIAFSGLPMDSDAESYLADHYEISYRGSLRNRVSAKAPLEKNQHALVVGDIDYGLGDSTNFQIIPLHATAKEVKEVAASLKASGTKPIILKGSAASEKTVIDKLEKQSYTLQHYATHGFFLPHKTKGKMRNLSVYEYRLTEIDNPLFRSGLILGNINSIWINRDSINASNDGILTAYEIATLDLSNTALAVLSGCVTGLGDIHAAEGILGLRYAFKLAGVQNLILSLWEVDDQATSEFMGYFYKAYEQCHDAKEALTKARKLMRSKHESAQYWAGFVLYQ